MTPNLNNFFDEIKQLAERSDEEICGFLLYDGFGSLSVYPVKNVAPSDRRSCFEISTDEQLNFYRTGRVAAIYHSHVIDGHEFSDLDIATSNNAELPIMVYSRKTHEFNFYRPASCIPPLEDRAFVLGVQDCAQLVTDYYKQKLGVALRFFARPPSMLESGYALLKTYTEDHRLVRTDSLEAGTILLMSIMGDTRVNHAGVYLGNDLLLHQLFGRASVKQVLTPSWKSRIKLMFRPK